MASVTEVSARPPPPPSHRPQRRRPSAHVHPPPPQPLHILADVGVATKLLSAYTRRGPNLEALKTALFKPMSLVLSRKKLELEVEPTAVYAAQLEELRFKSDTELRADVTAAEAWALPEVKRIVQARIRNLVEVAELFLTRIIAVRGVLPYGVRAIARKIYSTTADRFPRATDGEKMRGAMGRVSDTAHGPRLLLTPLLPLQASPTSSSSPSSARRSSIPRPSTSARTRTGRRRR